MAWLRRSARLVRIGVVAALRNTGLRALALAGALIAGVYAWSMGSLAGSTAVVLAAWLGRAYGVAACLWFAYAAIRDLNEREGAAIRSKPVDGAHLVLVHWATGLAVWWLLLLAPFAGAAIGQLVPAGTASLVSHGLGYLRAAAVVGIAATLSFALSRLLRSPLGGVLVMFAWFCAMGGVALIPSYLRPDYAQNRPLFAAAAALVLALAAVVVERFRRGELRRPAVPVLVILVLGLLTAAGAARARRLMPVPESPTPLNDAMQAQHLEVGKRIPGFWLPDGRGGLVRTAPHHGKILLVYMFAADDTDAARTLPALAQIQRDYGPRGVVPIGICLSPDQEDGWALVRGSGHAFPIGSDRATVRASLPPETPVALAYNAQLLPLLVVTDRRRVARRMQVEPFYDITLLRQYVEERLAAEPE